jgi:hypothetical protein
LPPKLVAVQCVGIFGCGATRKAAETALSLFLDAVKVVEYSRRFGGPRYMRPDLLEFILGWEVEQYRSRVSLSTDDGRP